MDLPFTREAFYGVFRDYNEAVWPAQALLLALGIAAVAAILRPRPGSDRTVSAILAFLWAWLALAYHLAFFAPINPLAYGFAAASLAGAAIFLWQGAIHRRLRFGWPGRGWAAAGASHLAFTLAVYPAWSWYAGHRYPAMPTFGLPCPTTLFTIGLLAFLVPPYPRGVLVVPILWCAVGAQAAFLLGVPQDLSLIVGGVTGLVLLVRAGSASTAASIQVRG